jgi:ribosomal protein S15P/S13E
MNEILIKLIEKRAKLAKYITNNDPDKLHALAEWLDLYMEINQLSPQYRETTITGRDII